MKEKSLVEMLLNDGEDENVIIKSFYPKKKLSPVIFDSNFKLINDVKEKLLSISKEFMDFLGVDFFIHDIDLTGSIANYGWSKYSDIDLHIILDFDESPHNNVLLKEFFNSKLSEWNNKYKLKIKNHDVEIYIQDIKEPHISSGVYSILNNKWIITPTKKDINIDERKIIEKSHKYEKLIDKLESEYKNDNNVENQVENLLSKIKKFRKIGLTKHGEYSYENLTFKFLRRNGYIKKLKNLKDEIIEKKLSLKQ